MNFTDKKFYELLPSWYRIKDHELGYVNKDGETIGPLRELIGIIAQQAGIAEKNIAELYDNWFIETCKEWAVPYIGDLLGVRSLNKVTGSAAVVSQRAYVANTIRYRRRKGVAPVLEQLALDVAGWRAHVVEFFEFLCTTQYMKHIRLHCPVAPDLRRMNQLDLVNSPFDTIAHTADVRHISNGRGKYNIPNIGLFVWRLQSYPVSFSEPGKLPCSAMPGEFVYTFDPVGHNIHLFNTPQTETSITHISTEVNVPGLLRRRALFDELEARRQALVDGIAPEYYFFDDRNEIEGDDTTKKHSVFEVYTGSSENFDLIPPEEVLICDLEECCTPPTKLVYKKLEEDGNYQDVTKNISVAVDPVSGRFKFSDPNIAKDVRVNYSYGFSGDIGAGTYDRQDTIADIFQNKNVWQVGVSKSIKKEDNETIHTSIKNAVDEWNVNSIEGTIGVIVIMDNCSYEERLDITIKEKSQLLIIAANWPKRDREDGSGFMKRISGDIAASDLRPYVKNNITVTGEVGVNDYTSKTGGELTINGLLIEGKFFVKKGNLGVLNIICSTLHPDYSGLVIGAGIRNNNPVKKSSNQWLKLSLKRTICGPVLLLGTPLDLLETEDCIIDNTGGWAIKSKEAPVQFRRTSFFGDVIAKIIEAENCIFNDDVIAIRRQAGCIRYSYLTIKNTETPRRYRCQPDLEISTQTEEAEKQGPLTQPEKDQLKKNVAAWLIPVFTSVNYGHHAYAHLAPTCPEQINTGADNGSEMGGFSFLMNPQRAANLRIALNEYLRVGLEAGIFFAT